MEFNLMDSSFRNKPPPIGIRSTNTIHLDKFQQLSHEFFQETPESPDLEFSGAAPSHFHNPYTPTPPQHFPYFAHNIETTNFTEFPCTTLSFQKHDSMEAMREMIFRMAMMQPVQVEPESVKPPKRKNVKISKDPQSVAARHRRERISHRIRILQRMVPGGTKLDTASMLEEAVHYMKFLKRQVQMLEQAASAVGGRPTTMAAAAGFFPVVGSVQMLS